jgi:hypothetical protein
MTTLQLLTAISTADQNNNFDSASVAEFLDKHYQISTWDADQVTISVGKLYKLPVLNIYHTNCYRIQVMTDHNADEAHTRALEELTEPYIDIFSLFSTYDHGGFADGEFYSFHN